MEVSVYTKPRLVYGYAGVNSAPTQYVNSDGTINTFDLAPNFYAMYCEPLDGTYVPLWSDLELMQIMHFYMSQIFGVLYTTDANLVLPPAQLVYGGGSFELVVAHGGC